MESDVSGFRTASSRLLAVATSLILLYACRDGRDKAASPPPPAGAAAPAIELIVDNAVSGNLARGETRTFEIEIAAGEFIDLEVVQHSIDVVVRLLDPDRAPRIEVDKLTGTSQPERLLWMAEEPGRHHVEIAALDQEGNAGRFEVILRARRPATAEDRKRVEAEKAFALGGQLVAAEAASEAAQAFERAYALWQELDELPRQADALFRLGQLHYEQKDSQRAIEAFEALLAIREQVPVPWQEGDTHHWLGYIAFELEDLQRARDHYLKALKLRQQAGFAAGEARTRNNLGLTLRLLGDPQQALEQYETALVTWRRIGNRGGEAQTLHNRGRCHLFFGQEAEALDDLGRALEIRRSLGSLRRQAATLNAIGLAHHRRGEPQQAFDAFARALELREESGDLRGQAVTLIATANIHQEQGRLDQAEADFAQALEISRKLEDRRTEGFALHGLGRVLDARGLPEDGLERFAAALDRFETIDYRSGQVLTLGSMSLAERRRGQWTQARTYLERVLAAIEQQRVTLASHTLRYSFFATKQSYYDRYVDLLMRMHQHQPAAGHDAEALTASERARARSQLEILIDSDAEIRRGVDPELRQRERELELRIEAAERRRQWMLEVGKGEDRLAEAERKLRDLFRQYSRVQGRIRLASPRYAALTQPRPLSAVEVQRRVVDRDTLLLEFDLGPDRSFLWVVSPDAIHSFELPPEAEIEKTARRAYKLLRSSHQTAAEVEFELRLEKLGDMLLGQVGDLLVDKRLLIVSEGALQYIPFAALPAPGTSEDSVPLGARNEIVSIPSASMLAVMREQLAGRSPAGRLVAVLADPVFELDDTRVLGLPQAPDPAPASRGRSHRQPTPRRFERLTFSQLEADRILALVPREESYKAIGFDADRDAIVSGRLSDFRFLHFATHGELNTEYPELSRLVLSRVDAAGEPRDDGSLFAHEIYDLELPADLVVLSACETALGAEIRGEGLLGLTQGFFYAGAARILVSLWKVDDEATAELMARFYENLLKGGQKPASALRDAQASIRRERKWRAPYYWAGFILLGEYR